MDRDTTVERSPCAARARSAIPVGPGSARKDRPNTDLLPQFHPPSSRHRSRIISNTFSHPRMAAVPLAVESQNRHRGWLDPGMGAVDPRPARERRVVAQDLLGWLGIGFRRGMISEQPVTVALRSSAKQPSWHQRRSAYAVGQPGVVIPGRDREGAVRLLDLGEPCGRVLDGREVGGRRSWIGRGEQCQASQNGRLDNAAPPR